MASLLAKFRIDYASLTMVEDITEKPKEETQQLFNKILRDYAGKTEEESEESVKSNFMIIIKSRRCGRR